MSTQGTPAVVAGTPDSVTAAKAQYDRALQAQMMRAQKEQGAPQGFAAQAYAAQQAYLAQTAEKSLRYDTSGEVPIPVMPQAAGQAVSGRSPAAFGLPPVHIAPGPNSTPPPVPVQPAQIATTSHEVTPPVVDQRNRVGLQDRIAGFLARPEYQSNAPTPAPPAMRVGRIIEPELDTPPVATPLPTIVHQRPEVDPMSAGQITNPVLQDPQLVSAANPVLQDQQVHQAADRMQSMEQVDGQFSSPPETRLAMRLPVGREPSLTAPQQVDVQGSGLQPPAINPLTPFGRPMGAAGDQRRDAPVSVLSKGPLAGSRQDEQAPANRFEVPGSTPARLPGFQESVTPAEKPVGEVPLPGNQLRRNQDPAAELNRIDNGLQQRLNQLDSPTETDPAELERRVEGLNEQTPSDRLGRDQGRTVPARKSCDEYRSQLLNRSIRDIALNISPPANSGNDQYEAISRSWTDRLGNIIATGSMVDLSRGYVIIDSDQGRQKIPYAKLSDADWAAVSSYWRIPELCSLGETAPPSRNWVPQTFMWKASALCHKPLYFENRQLERYGHSHGPIMQPIHSTGHFFVSLLTLPYQSAIHPPSECQYALGFYRPGDCAPWLKDPIPISLSGIARQALVTTGYAVIP